MLLYIQYLFYIKTIKNALSYYFKTKSLGISEMLMSQILGEVWDK